LVELVELVELRGSTTMSRLAQCELGVRQRRA